MNYEIILATNNKHKLKEVREILSPHKIVVYGLSDLIAKPEEVIENGSTYVENALIKAKAVQKITTMPIISDDSGLEINALNNEIKKLEYNYEGLKLEKNKDIHKYGNEIIKLNKN